MNVENSGKDEIRQNRNLPAVIAAVIIGAAIVISAIITILLLVLPVSSGSSSSEENIQKIRAEDLSTDPENVQDAQAEVKSEITIAGESSAEESSSEENISTDPVMVRFDVSASSTLEAAGYNYDVSNLTDLDASTCWADGESGNGTGETITFSIGQAQTVRGLAVLPGYCKSEDLYTKNAAPSAVRIEYDGQTTEYTIDDADLTYNSSDPMAGTVYIDFGQEIQISECKVTITGVRDGSKYDDCCISEMYLYK